MKLWDFRPKLFNPLYLRIVFKNRQNAGQILGDNLKMLFKSGKNDGFDLDDCSILVVGIPRGGLIVADEIAKKLNCDLDLIYPIRIITEDNESTLGSVLPIPPLPDPGSFRTDNHGNKFLMNLNNEFAEEYVKVNERRLLAETLEKSKKYNIVSHKPISGKIVILVDDGVYTGASALTALQWLRIQKPNKLIFATPVAPKNIVSKLEKDPNILVDHLEILKTPSAKNYKSVDFFYNDFENVSDTYIDEIIQKKIS